MKRSDVILSFLLSVVVSFAALLPYPSQAAPYAYVTNYGPPGNFVSVVDLATNTVIGSPITVGSQAYGIALSTAGDRLYVANFEADTVSVINTANKDIVATIPVGDFPSHIAVHPTRPRIYVTNTSGNSVSVIDTTTNTVVKTLGVGNEPAGIDVNPAGTHAYVACSKWDINAVYIINAVTDEVFPTWVYVGETPTEVLVGNDGSRVYVSNTGSNSISVIDAGVPAVIATISVPYNPVSMVMSPDSSRLYVVAKESDGYHGRVHVINPATNAVVGSPIPVGVMTRGIGINSDGTRVYVTDGYVPDIYTYYGTLSVIDTATNTVAAAPVILGRTEAGGIAIATGASLTVPGIMTSTVTGISTTTATGGGTVTSTGGSAVSARGVCWGTALNPTLANTHTSDGSGTGAFTSSLTGLTPSTSYHVRAYAVNSQGTAYGPDVQFTTPAPPAVLPTVSTNAVVSITSTSSWSGGNVTADGGATVTARGICWGTAANPTLADTCLSGGAGTGSYPLQITGLTPSTTYHVRAYATNSVGTAYGSDVPFTTSAPVVVPTVTTYPISGITSTTANGSGNITTTGGETPSARGLCRSTSSNPTTADICTNNGPGSGYFSSQLTGLTPSTLYHVRAYATNSAGTGYGNDVQFTTSAPPVAPTVTTTAISGTPYTSAIGGGNVTASGGVTVTARGVCWSSSLNPTITDSHTSNDSGTGSFVSYLTGLTPNSTYHVRAYATNSVGTSYGSDLQFTTAASPGVGPFAYITNYSGNSVTVIDTSTNSVVGAPITVGYSPYGVAVNPAGTRVYVANQYSNSVSIINAATLAVIGTVTVGSDPGGVAVNPSGSRVYITNRGNNSVSVIDTATNTTVGSPIPVGYLPDGIVVNPSGTRVYVTNHADKTLSVIDTASNAVIGSPIAMPDYPGGIAVSPDGAKVYVASNPAGVITVLDAATNTVVGSPIAVPGWPEGIALSPDGTLLYAANNYGNSVSVIDTATNSVVGAAIAVGNYPEGIAVTPSGARVYVANSSSDSVSVIDTSTRSVIATIPVGYYPAAFGMFIGPATPGPPSVTTAPVSAIGGTTASGGGNVTYDGGSAVTGRGVCWNTSPNPTTADSHTSNGSGTGPFTSSITGLTQATTYHVRAYATNSSGTAYGSDLTFSTAVPLSLMIQGLGSGVVHSTSPDINCPGGVCEQFYPFGEYITLTPSAASHCLFGGWSGDCPPGTGECVLLMDSVHSVLAGFDIDPGYAAWIDSGPDYYSSLGAAYQAAGGGSLIKACQVEFTEELLFNLAKAITISGGYDSSYSSSSGVTAVNGTMIVRNGSVKVRKLVLR